MKMRLVQLRVILRKWLISISIEDVNYLIIKKLKGQSLVNVNYNTFYAPSTITEKQKLLNEKIIKWNFKLWHQLWK